MKMRNLELSLGFSSAGAVVGGGVEVDDIVAVAAVMVAVAVAVAVEVEVKFEGEAEVEMEVEVEGLGCPGLTRAGRRFLDPILKRSMQFVSNKRKGGLDDWSTSR